ncbi:hypothetical protein OSTOST_11044, partial [Ostertagia ostertagi]
MLLQRHWIAAGIVLVGESHGSKSVVAEAVESTSGLPSVEKAEQGNEDISNLEPFVQFHCSICNLTEKCFFGDLKASDGLDPFVPPRRVKGRKPLLSDFLVLGSSCSLCSQSVCLDKPQTVAGVELNPQVSGGGAQGVNVVVRDSKEKAEGK